MIGDGDIAAIISNGDFDEAAIFTITPANPPDPAVTLTVRGWFTDGSDASLLFGNVEIEAQKPSLTCNTDDLASITSIRNKSVLIRSVNYEVERIGNLGTGISVVYLKT